VVLDGLEDVLGSDTVEKHGLRSTPTAVPGCFPERLISPTKSVFLGRESAATFPPERHSSAATLVCHQSPPVGRSVSFRAARASTSGPLRCASKSRPVRLRLPFRRHRLFARPRQRPCHRVLPGVAGHSRGCRFLAFSWRHLHVLGATGCASRAREP